MAEFYDLEGREVSYETWAELFRSQERYVAREEVAERGVEVSTVWTGLPWMLEEADEESPLIFETMVFEIEDETFHDLGCWRWATREAAKNGHQKIVDDIRSGELVLTPVDYSSE
jgi:hypothetical protein